MRGLLQMAVHDLHHDTSADSASQQSPLSGAVATTPRTHRRLLQPRGHPPHLATAFDCCEHWVYTKQGKIRELADIDGFSSDCPLDWSSATGSCRHHRENMDFIGTIKCMSLRERDNCRGYLMHWVLNNASKEGKYGREKLIAAHKHLQCAAKGSTGKPETLCKLVDGDTPDG
mmetsp:Transcript_34231/g.78043  ORF Transcript_34231/g.78043 Transcript_34231/m.78043 type:complete len:173 (-) Transcript_34231:44-562(-)